MPRTYFFYKKTFVFFFIFLVIWAVCSWDVFWHLTWFYFGRVLGGFWVPRWAQKTKKIDLGPFKKLYKKICCFGCSKNWFWKDFGVQDGCPRGAPEIGFGGIFWSWAGLGAKMAPRPLQRPPKTDFPWFWNPTWWILEPNFMDFGTQLGCYCVRLALWRAVGAALDIFYNHYY